MTSKNFVKKSCLLIVLSGLMSSAAYAINVPNDPRGTEISQSTVKWEWGNVSDAARYEVTVDGIYQGTTQDSKFYSRNLWQGEHSMQVRAVDSSGATSGKTDSIKIVVDGQSSAPSTRAATSGFTTPGNTAGSENGNGGITWTWDSVSGATGYQVTVDGAFAGDTSESTFTSSNLWIGEHSMTVKAVDGSGNISVQSATAKTNVTSLASSSAASSSTNGAAPPPSQSAASSAGDASAAGVKSMIDPASYGYPEVSQKSGYELVFSDEFNGTALNPHRWHSQLRWDGEFNGERYEYRVINGEDQFYVNVLSPDEEHLEKIAPTYNPFQFDGSTLSIRAKKNPLQTSKSKRTYGSLEQISAQQTFLSGAISTHEKFSQKYGYFEARIKIPSAEGTFPAFWLFHENRAWEGTQRTEIDIMENLGHAPWYIYNSFHYFKNVTRTYGGDATFVKPEPSGQIYTGTDYSENFHVYAVKWTPGRVTWFIDGQQTSETVNNEVNFEELYVMINLAMGGNWTNFPTTAGGLGRASNARFPNANDLVEFKNPALEIDYVRVYKTK